MAATTQGATSARLAGAAAQRRRARQPTRPAQQRWGYRGSRSRSSRRGAIAAAPRTAGRAAHARRRRAAAQRRQQVQHQVSATVNRDGRARGGRGRDRHHSSRHSGTSGALAPAVLRSISRRIAGSARGPGFPDHGSRGNPGAGRQPEQFTNGMVNLIRALAVAIARRVSCGISSRRHAGPLLSVTLPSHRPSLCLRAPAPATPRAYRQDASRGATAGSGGRGLVRTGRRAADRRRAPAGGEAGRCRSPGRRLPGSAH